MPRFERQPDLTHEHEFRPEPDDVIVDEDVWVTFPCMWAQVTGSQTSDRLDETFYEYGAECQAYKRLRYTIVVDHPNLGLLDVRGSGEWTMDEESAYLDAYNWLDEHGVAHPFDGEYPGKQIRLGGDVDAFEGEIVLTLEDNSVLDEGEFY